MLLYMLSLYLYKDLPMTMITTLYPKNGPSEQLINICGGFTATIIKNDESVHESVRC